MYNILLLGGSGILSSEICALAISKGHTVSMINRGNRPQRIPPQAIVHYADLKKDSLDRLIELLADNRFDIVIDFVAYHVEQLHKHLTILQGKCKQYIFISTAAAYIDQGNKPFTEDMPVGDTGWSYAYNKVACEKYLYDNKNVLSFEYTIVRPYVTYDKTRIPYQVSPLEYYTIINRILCNKPIPLFGHDVRCNLTTSMDFAVGVVGLFFNEEAYNNVFNITSNHIISWHKVISIIGRKLEREVCIVELPIECLKKGAYKLGIDTDEIRYDKSRTMVFSNTKIRSLVPDFRGDTTFENGIDASLTYFMNSAKIINYAWDARIDRLIDKNTHGKYKRKLKLSMYQDTCNKKEKVSYILHRFNFFYFLFIFIKKCSRLVNRFVHQNSLN